jgi:hypothetical protein
VSKEGQKPSRRDLLKLTGAVLGSFAMGAAQKFPGSQFLPRAILHVTITDQEKSRIIPARCYLTDTNGGFWSPSDAIVYSMPPERHFAWPSENSGSYCRRAITR